MNCCIGIDIGITPTKIVAIENGKLKGAMLTQAVDPVTAAYGAFGKFLNDNSIALRKVEKLALTGVGASYIKSDDFLSLPALRVNEFEAIGKGGRYLTGFDRMLIANVGTGTSFVKIENGKATHIGGTGVGGGTLVGLARRIAGVQSFDSIAALIEKGDLSKVDLTLGDITVTKVSDMPMDTTAANFAKLCDTANKEDILAGVFNLIFQTVGMLSVFAAKGAGMEDIVLTGNLSTLPMAREVLEKVKGLHGLDFHFPENGEYATAIGAAILTKNE